MAKTRVPMSREARATYREIQKGLDRLARSMADVRDGLRHTERRIETDARARIRLLRRDARKQLALLETRRREATRALRRLSLAAGGSWRDLRKAAVRALADGRTAADSVVKRFRRALRG